MSPRTVILITVAVAALSQLATALIATPSPINWSAPPRTRFPKLLLWNASASAPRGLYLLRPAWPLHVGELITVAPSEPLACVAAMRGYLPLGVPLLKHIAALDGQTVCRVARVVTIDGRAVAIARDRDSLGRSLPRWQGCQTLRAGQVFLLNPTIPDSFDGRYFGVLSAEAVTSRAEPLWTFSEH